MAAGRGWLRLCCVSRCSSRGGRCPRCTGRRRGFVQFLGKVVTCPLLRRQVHEGVAGAVPAVVDVPENAATWGLAHSEGASDSVHRAV